MTARERPHGWPPHYRLRTRREIVPVQRRGARRRGAWMTLCVRPNGLGHLRMGLAVSKKVGNAPVRNVTKRRLRDVFRHLADDVGGVDVMVLAKPSIAGRSRAELEDEVRRLLQGDRPARAR